jgi:hypothetical protein
MKDGMKVRERLERAKAKAREYEGRLKDIERTIAGVERALRGLEPQVRRALAQSQTVARSIRAGVRAGAARYRASRPK